MKKKKKRIGGRFEKRKKYTQGGYFSSSSKLSVCLSCLLSCISTRSLRSALVKKSIQSETLGGNKVVKAFEIVRRSRVAVHAVVETHMISM